MTVKLYTIGDIARELGIKAASLYEWPDKGWMPKPYGVAGGKETKMWTEGQVQAILTDYQARKENRYGNNKPVIIKQPIPKQEAIDNYTNECPECGDNVFNMKVHNEFAHGGKHASFRK